MVSLSFPYSTNTKADSSSAFKFKLQEDKYYNALKQTDLKVNEKLNSSQANFNSSKLNQRNESLKLDQNFSNPSKTFTNYQAINESIHISKSHYDNEEGQKIKKLTPDLNEGGHYPLTYTDMQIPEIKLDYNNASIKLLVGRYQKEIKDMKGYILKLNSEIRKSTLCNMVEMPDLTSKINSINHKDSSEVNSLVKEIVETFEDTLSRLVNPNYINPLFEIYDSHIKLLDKEIDDKKDKIKNLDKEINYMINENSLLREENLNLKQEVYKLVSTKVINSDGRVLFDEQYITQLEERANLLSKENSMLALNFQKLAKEFFDFKCEVNEAYNDFTAKSKLFNQVSLDSTQKSMVIEQLNTQMVIIENKLFNALDEVASLSTIKEEQAIAIQRQSNELESLIISNNFYKQQLSSYGYSFS